MLPIQIEFNLIRKQFKIYGFFNIISLITVISIMLFGIRFLIGFMPDPYLIRSLIASSIVLLGFFHIHPDKNSKNKLRMHTFFPSLRKSISSYFNYKRFIIVNFFIIFLLMPSSFTLFEAKIFFFLFFTIQVVMFLNTICYRYLSLRYAETIHAFLRIGYWVLMSQSGIKVTGVDLWAFTSSFSISIFITLTLFLLVINFLIIRSDRNNN